MGIVENTDSLLAFSLITVLKKDQTLRLCVVYRKLNKITGSGRINAKSGRYVCQTVNSKIFHEDWFVEWILENCDGEDSKKYTAFSYPLGNIVWTLSFGLTGVPMAFTKLMRKLTWGRQDIVSYFNGMFHTTLDEHISGIQSMLQTIIKFGLKVILSKTFVSFKEVTCFWISDKAG